MFSSRENYHTFEKLVEEGNYQDALAFIKNNKTQITTFLRIKNVCGWFNGKYKESKNPKHWLNIWEKLAYSEENELKPFKFLLGAEFFKLLSPDQMLPFLEIYFARYPANSDDSAMNFLAIKATYNQDISLALATLNSKQKSIVFEKLLTLALQKYNVSLLQELKQSDKSLFQQIIEKLNLSSSQEDRLSALLALDKNAALQFSQTMEEFSNGLLYTGLGGGPLTFEGGLLTLAQIKKRKEQGHKEKDNAIWKDFHPTMLKIGDNTAIQDYFNHLKTAQKPLHEKFIMLDAAHWIAGEIAIDQNGKAQVFFIDSLGYDEEDKEIYRSTQIAIEEFSNVFPNHVIYFSSEKRQNTFLGCSIFAIDDTVQMTTIENYLDPKYKETGLFGYLADAKEKTIKANEATPEGSPDVICCRLPLPLQRTMQSTGLFPLIEARPSSEQKLPVNKRKQTAAASANTFFVENEAGKKLNKRLDHKLRNIADHNADFLLHTSVEERKEMMQDFTLSGFKTRLKAADEKVKENSSLFMSKKPEGLSASESAIHHEERSRAKRMLETKPKK